MPIRPAGEPGRQRACNFGNRARGTRPGVSAGAEGLDLYHPKEVVTSGELDGGRHLLAAGEHKLEVRILPMNPVATPRNMFGLDFIKVEKK